MSVGTWLRIKTAKEEEMGEIIDLLKLCGIQEPGATEYALRLGMVLVAVDGRTVSTCMYRRTSGTYWHMYGICINPGHRRQGIAESLCREAEREMRRQGAIGYVGEAIDEETAQYYVRALGVRICRLSFRAWRRRAVPYGKDFQQDGRWDRFVLAIRGLLIRAMRIRRLGTLLEAIIRRIESL